MFLKLNDHLIFLIFFFSVVFPNAFRPIVIPLMFFSFFLCLPYIRIFKDLKIYYLIYVFSILITLIFLLLGIYNGASYESVIQVLITYIISPFMWLIILTYIVQYFSNEKIINLLMTLSLLSCASVALYFYLFLSYGPSSVSFFGSTSNVHISENGYSGAIMHVFGSLIFLGGGIFFCPNISNSNKLNFFVIIFIFVTVIFAGRTALTLSILVSLFLYFFLLGKKLLFKRNPELKYFPLMFLFIFLLMLLVAVIKNYFGVDFLFIISLYFEKIVSGGGEARIEQAVSLITGIENAFALGTGHGVGTEYIRNDDFPWRYELVWLATILRTGIFGAFVYILPYIFYLIVFFIRLKNSELSKLDIYFFGAWLAVFLASNTNPYIEAISFQWMYILPLVFLFNHSRSFKKCK